LPALQSWACTGDAVAGLGGQRIWNREVWGCDLSKKFFEVTNKNFVVDPQRKSILFDGSKIKSDKKFNFLKVLSRIND
jgi:hypothetical protein